MRRGVRDPNRFDAFISYGHAADGTLAPELQKGLERLASPWYARRVLRVFRDDTGLSVNPDLWGSITAAMDASEWLVLLLSPQAAVSPWVAQEIAHWLSHRPVERILLVQTQGELHWDPARGDYDPDRSTCLPPALLGRFPAEPRHLDLRWAREGEQLDLRHARFRDAVADLAAPIHGVPKDEIEGEDVRQHRRHVRARRAGIAALCALLVAAVAASVVAFDQRDRAQRQTDVATSQRLAVQAADVAPRALDRGLLLAVAGHRLDPSPQTARGLLATLSQSPALGRFEYGLGTSPTAMALSPDRDAVVVISAEGLLGTFDARTGDPLTEAGEAPVTNPLEVAYSPDGALLAVAGDQVALLDAHSLRPVALPLIRRQSNTEWVAFSPDGSRLAMSGTDGFVRVARVPEMTLVAPPRRLSTDGRTTSLTFTADGRRVLVGTHEGTVAVLDAATLRPADDELPVVNDGETYAVTLSPDGRTLVTSGDRGRLLLWDARTLTRRGAPLRFHRSYPYAVAFSPDGEVFASSDDQGKIAVWETATGRRVNRFTAQGELVFDLAFSADRELLSAAGGGVVRWDLDAVTVGTRLLSGGPPIRAMALLPDGAGVVTADDAGRVRSIDASGGEVAWTAASGLSETYGLALAPDGALVAVTGRRARPGSSAVVILDGEDGHVVRTIPIQPRSFAWGVDWSPDGRRLAVGGRYPGEVVVLDPRRDDPVVWRAFSETRAVVTAIAFSPDGERLVYGTGTGYLSALRSDDGRRVWVVRGNANVGGVRWTGEGRSLLVADGLGTLIRRDVADGRPLGEPLALGVGEVYGLELAADGRLAAAAGFSGEVALVDLTTDTPLYAIGGHRGRVTSAIPIDDGRALLSAGDDGAILRQTIDPGAWRDAACEKAGRVLTEEEIEEFGVGDGADDVCS